MHVKMHVLSTQLVLCIWKLLSHCCCDAWSSVCQRSLWSDVLIAVLTSGRAEAADHKVINLGSNLRVVPKW